MDERFARTERLIGTEALERLHGAFVTVVGLGAVGSYAIEGLARAGVGRLRLVDFDVVRPTNINRQLYALESTLGQSKALLAKQRVTDINPRCAVEALQLFAHTDTLSEILSGPPQLVIDAIDSLTPKVELITAASRSGIPLLSSMGAALRTDPAQVRTGPLAEVTTCPLARRIRPYLRARKVPMDFTVVYSLEPVDNSVLTAPNTKPPEHEYLERGRKRQMLGSLPTITGIFGLTLANTALAKLLGGKIRGLAASAT